MSNNHLFRLVQLELSLLLDGVGDEQAGVLLFVQQHHGSQVSHPLLTVAGAGDHPNALHLTRRATTPLHVKLLQKPIAPMSLRGMLSLRLASAPKPQPRRWERVSDPVPVSVPVDSQTLTFTPRAEDLTTVQSVLMTEERLRPTVRV